MSSNTTKYVLIGVGILFFLVGLVMIIYVIYKGSKSSSTVTPTGVMYGASSTTMSNTTRYLLIGGGAVMILIGIGMVAFGVLRKSSNPMSQMLDYQKAIPQTPSYYPYQGAPTPSYQALPPAAPPMQAPMRQSPMSIPSPPSSKSYPTPMFTPPSSQIYN